MAMNRIRAIWTGISGPPGVSTFYSLNPGADLPLIHGFFESIVGSLPGGVTITLGGEGDIIDETTGELTGAWSGTAPAESHGEGTPAWAGPAGACVTWLTGVVMDGSRLKGKTYLVPLQTLCYGSDGTIEPATLATLRGVASSLAEESQLVVWHRPRLARAADGSRKAVTARAGGYASMNGATVADKAAVLTSRRD